MTGKTTTTKTKNADGSETVTTVTINADGTKSTKRKTSRPRSKTPPRQRASQDGHTTSTSSSSSASRPRSKTPPHTTRSSASKSVPLRVTSGGSALLHALDPLQYSHNHKAHADNPAFEDAVKRCIPSEFVLIASQDDVTQAMEDYYAFDHYQLPRIPRGSSRDHQTGSAATCALLQLWHEQPPVGSTNTLTCHQVLHEMKQRIHHCSKLHAKPQITSSRPLGPPRLAAQSSAPFAIVPPTHQAGTRRALLIGVVTGEGADLKGPPNDCRHMQHFLQTKCGFSPHNITVLLDDNSREEYQPTKANILKGFQTLVQHSKPNDVVFVQYSGHGGAQKNDFGSYDSYILPSDYKTKGQIMDDTILLDLIKALPRGVHGCMLVDCCYSGTVGDLPYILKTTSDKQSIEKYFDTETRAEILGMETKRTTHPQEYQEWQQTKSEQKSLTAKASVLWNAAMKLASDAAKATVDAAAYTAHAASDAATYSVTAASDAATYTVTAASDAATYTAHRASDAATETGKVLGETASRVARTTSDSATHAMKSAADTSKAATETLGKAATQTLGVTTESLGAVARTTTDAASNVASSAMDVATKLTNMTLSPFQPKK